MLVYNSRLIGTPILSIQASSPIGHIDTIIVDPDNLKIVAFRLSGPAISRGSSSILDIKSIREYSDLGMIIDSTDELIADDDVVKISKILALNFDLIDLKVETKKGSKLGKVSAFTIDSNDFAVKQIIVKRPPLKAFIDPELTISCREIVEITDYKIIVKDEEKTIKEKVEKEEFIPNFVNPFRKTEQAPSTVDSQSPADINKQ